MHELNQRERQKARTSLMEHLSTDSIRWVRLLLQKPTADMSESVGLRPLTSPVFLSREIISLSACCPIPAVLQFHLLQFHSISSSVSSETFKFIYCSRSEYPTHVESLDQSGWEWYLPYSRGRISDLPYELMLCVWSGKSRLELLRMVEIDMVEAMFVCPVLIIVVCFLNTVLRVSRMSLTVGLFVGLRSMHLRASSAIAINSSSSNLSFSEGSTKGRRSLGSSKYGVACE